MWKMLQVCWALWGHLADQSLEFDLQALKSPPDLADLRLGCLERLSAQRDLLLQIRCLWKIIDKVCDDLISQRPLWRPGLTMVWNQVSSSLPFLAAMVS